MLIEGRTSSLILSLVVAAIMYWNIKRTQSGWKPNIRKMVALDQIEDAIGRCAEMGRPAHFTACLARLNNAVAPMTMAGLKILGFMARLCARLGVPIITSIANPQIIPISEEIVRQAYIMEGRLDEFNPEYSIRYLASNQKSYISAVLGLMKEEQPGASVAVGPVYDEIYTVLESGKAVGAITIGGTARMTQIPTIVIIADFTLIGEEIYAAGAYISQEPEQLGMIAGTDMTKLLVIAIMLIGFVLINFGIDITGIFKI